MPITLLPWLILFYISKVVAPVALRMDPRYLNLLTALICPVSVTITAPGASVKYSVFPKIINKITKKYINAKKKINTEVT
jgi:hypothetical protein